MRRALLALTLAATLPVSAMAKDVAAPGLSGRISHSYVQPACVNGMTKNASISISFNGQEDSLAKARAAFDTQKKMMEAEAEKIGGDALQLSSYNYNVSMNANYNNGAQTQMFNFSGNLNYQVNSEELAQKLSDKLAEMKRQFSMNLNANRCNN